MNESAHRLGLMGSIDHEHDRKIQYTCQICCRSLARLWTVEESHDTFDNDEVGVILLSDEKRVDQALAHAPHIEIDAWTPRSRLMEARVDIIGSDLCRYDA